MLFAAKHVEQPGKIIFIPDRPTLPFLVKLGFAKLTFFKVQSRCDSKIA